MSEGKRFRRHSSIIVLVNAFGVNFAGFNMPSPIFLRAFGLLVGLTAAIVLAVLHSFNHFQKIEYSDPSSCIPVRGVHGPEDLQIDHTNRIIFVSSFNRRNPETERGSVHAIAMDDLLASDSWRDRTNGVPADFQPIGLSYFIDQNTRRLFVANAAKNAVELYDVLENGDLEHLESFSEKRLSSVSDVVGVGPRSFYVTNDVAAGRDSILGRLQFLGRAETGAIFHFNGVSWRRSASGIKFANGVALSPNGEKLFVAESAGMSVKSYDRDLETGALTLVDTIKVPGAADNINISERGTLLVAANPKPLSTVRHSRFNDVLSPSQILEFDLDEATNDIEQNTETVYQSSGEQLSAATVADRLGRKLVVGALAEDRFLICDSTD